MTTTPCHLDDEHMRFYEWSGTTGGAMLPAARKRRHPWHASYAVLALLTSLLIMQGCDNKGPAERALQDQRNETGPAQEAGGTLDDARETTGENIEQLGKDLQER